MVCAWPHSRRSETFDVEVNSFRSAVDLFRSGPGVSRARHKYPALCKVTPIMLHGVVSPDKSPCRMTAVTLHGVVSPDTTPCRMAGVTLHGVVSPERRPGGPSKSARLRY